MANILKLKAIYRKQSKYKWSRFGYVTSKNNPDMSVSSPDLF